MDFQTRLRELRKGRKLSQTALGNEIGVTSKQIQRYELGENDPTLPVLIAIANYFNVSLGYLVGLSDDMKGADFNGKITTTTGKQTKGGENMDYSKISRITETSDSERAQEYLSIGWVLLTVAPGQDEEGIAYVLYSLGWPSEKGDPVFPPDKLPFLD